MSTSDAVTTQSPVLSSEDRSARIAVTVFPLLILAAFAIAMITPDTFKPLAPGVNWALGVIMFGMGLTLTLPDFGLIVKRPLPVLVGVVAQYLIMPLVGWALCYVFGLPDAVAVGVILVGCAPGGTASNVISYLAKADVALSVTMTSISTLLAPLMTPLLTAWLVGNRPRLRQGGAHDRNRGRHAEFGAGRDAGEDSLRLHPGDRAPGSRVLGVAQSVRRAAGDVLPSLEERRTGLNERGRGGTSTGPRVRFSTE